MKKLLSVVILILSFSLSGKCVRLITDSDIARWYLDADLVLICNVVHTDTTTVCKVDLYGKIVGIEIHDLQSIDLSSLKPGPYLISIFTDNKKWTEKIIKQ